MDTNNQGVEVSSPFAVERRLRFKMNRIPLGIKFLLWIQKDRDKLYRAHIFLLTFVAYASYHLSRKPISVVKDTLNANCTVNSTCHAWAPFDGSDSKSLLGYVDVSFLAAYAVGMYFSGYIAEHMDIRLFLTGGMMLSGVFSILFGLGYFCNIHSLAFFIIMQILAGLAQSSGWPAVVEAVGNWFGKGQRGLIMGIWNSHTSVGNIAGSAIAAVWSDDAWGWSFVVPGLIIFTVGLLVFLFLVTDPSHVDCSPPQHHIKPSSVPLDHSEDSDTDTTSLLNRHTPINDMMKPSPAPLDRSEESEADTASRLNRHTPINDMERLPQRRKGEHGADSRAVTFLGAFLLPGVIEYSLSLFFAKLVSYTFLYWLPYYISKTPIDGVQYDSRKAGDLSTFFDVGGIIGGIAAGFISDQSGCSGITCVVMLVLASPSVYFYRFYGNQRLGTNIGLMILSGIFVNGPYGLITTAVSANLGTQKALRGDTKAMATVTAIIDGTGSLGAALGPLLTSFISNKNWNYVFYMLIAANVLAALFLVRQVIFELQRHVFRRPQQLVNEPTSSLIPA